ncbi:unnamed protein product, partial [Staurois parvus]
MPASAGGHCQEHCRMDIVGAQDKVSDRGIPAAPHGIPECSLVLPLVLHSGIPPGRL